jgi:hypothetical protein
MQLPDSPTITVEAAAEILGVSTWSLYNSLRRGDGPLRPIRIGRRLIIPTQQLRRLLEIDDEVQS